MSTAFIQQIGGIIQRAEEALLSASILAIASLTILNVFCRSALGFSLAFAEEVSQFCIIMVCFVGLSYAASRGRHIRMTAIYDVMPTIIRKILMTMISGATAALLFTLAWYAASYVLTVYQLGGIYPTLRVPFYVVYSIALNETDDGGADMHEQKDAWRTGDLTFIVQRSTSE